MLITLENILPNRNRDLQFNPYSEDKIAELMFSIKETTFWGGVTVRPSPEHAGKYEQAYGMHRVEAARRCGIVDGEFIVKPLDDDMMLKMLDLENSESYHYSILSLLELVRSVVLALADGRIPPFDPDTSTKDSALRYAPSFIPGVPPSATLADRPYTAVHIAKRLGAKYVKTQGEDADKKVRVALDTLWLLETKDLSIASVKDLNVDQLYKLTSDIKRRKAAAIAARTETSAVATKLHAEKAKVDADRHIAEEKDRKAQAELQRKQAEAKKRDDEEAAERLSAEYKRRTEDAAKRALHFEAKRAILDAQIQENNQRSETAREQDKDLPVRHAASACLTKLKTIASEKNALRQELKSLSLKNLSQAERENLRQALLAVATWFEDQSIAFRPAIQVDVLKEARQKEKK